VAEDIMTSNIGSRYLLDAVQGDLNKRLADRRVTVNLDSKAKDWVTEKGYDPVFGARPLKRFPQRNVETKLARALMPGDRFQPIGVGASKLSYCFPT
jgi:ATP-dependent Clp protease ATP-binding subunit ClpA